MTTSETAAGPRTGIHNGNLMVAALKRLRDKPVTHLGVEVAQSSERFL